MNAITKILLGGTVILGTAAGLASRTAHRPTRPEKVAERVIQVPVRDDAELATLKEQLALANARIADLAGRLSTEADRQVQEAAGEAPSASPDGTADESVEQLVAAIEGMTARPDLYQDDLLRFVEDRLVRLLADDAEALAWTLARFEAAAGTPLGDMLIVALGQIKDPAVEQAGLRLLREGGSEGRLAAGLQLLESLDIENPETRIAVRDVLATSCSPRVLAAAIYALRADVVAPAEARQCAVAVGRLTGNPDPEVRRRAALSLAGWAPDEASLAPVVSSLSDPDPAVRTGAAFALGMSRFRSPGLVRALVARVADRAEDWDVREQAWRSLERFPLDESQFAVYAAFQAEHVAAGEVSADEDAEACCR